MKGMCFESVLYYLKRNSLNLLLRLTLIITRIYLYNLNKVNTTRLLQVAGVGVIY